MMINEKILRQVSNPVESIEEANDIIKKLESELVIVQGIGLAAPQIGILKRVAIIRHKSIAINIINPTDIELLDGTFVYKSEGCLSFPNVRRDTIRSCSINFLNNNFAPEVHYYSINEGPSKEYMDKEFVVAIQHEIDHLNGVLFFDHVLKKVISVGRNDPCPCGSTKKFKKCCLNNGKN